MNIVEAFIKKKNGLIIYISGLNNSGKSILADNISKDFNIKKINLFDYFNIDDQSNLNYINLPNNENVLDWYSFDLIKWNKVNDDISKYIKNGIIVSGYIFPKEHIKHTCDFHIHLKINKENLKKSIFDNIDKIDFLNKININDENNINFLVNKIIYTKYLHNLKNISMNIDKFINIDSMDNDDVYDVTFDFIIEKIKKYLYK
jgi:hypothetical protein